MWSERAARSPGPRRCPGAALTAAGAAAQTPAPAASRLSLARRPSAGAAPRPRLAAPLQNVPPPPAPSPPPAAPAPAPSPTGELHAGRRPASTPDSPSARRRAHPVPRIRRPHLRGHAHPDRPARHVRDGEAGRQGHARRVVAEGNVVFMRGEERLSGEKLDMDLDTSRGTFENALGYVSPGVLVEAKQHRAHRRQRPTGRGREVHLLHASPTRAGASRASSATLEVDDKVKATNVVFKVKDVPAFYIPYLIYPIQQDQRSTGILFPHFGQSDAPRLQHRHAGSSGPWAAATTRPSTSTTTRSSATGFGHEFRYCARPLARHLPHLLLPRARTAAAGSTTSTGTPSRPCPARCGRACASRRRARSPFQEQFQDNLDLASQRNRCWTAARCSAASGPDASSSRRTPRTRSSSARTARRTNTFDRRRHLPSLAVDHARAEVRRQPGSCSRYEGRGRARCSVGNQDHVDQYARFDINPRLSRPMSRLVPPAHARRSRSATRTTARTVDRGRRARPTSPIDRRYVEGSLEMRGPDVLARVRHARATSTPIASSTCIGARGDLDVPLEGRGVRRPSRASTTSTTSSGTNEVRYAPRAAALRQAAGRVGQARALRVLQLARRADLLRGHRRAARTSSTPTTRRPCFGPSGAPAALLAAAVAPAHPAHPGRLGQLRPRVRRQLPGDPQPQPLRPASTTARSAWTPRWFRGT